MRPIKDYSVARMIIVGFGLGIVIGGLRLAIRATLPASDWTTLLTGAVAGIVIAGTLAYFSSGGRDSQLSPRERSAK